MLAFIAFIILSAVFSDTPWQALAWFTFPLVCYLIARIPLKIAAGQVLTPLPIILFFSAFTWYQKGLSEALTLAITFTSAIAAAALVTLTTTIETLLDGLERWLKPLSRFGVNSDLVALGISLTIRLIPVIAESALTTLQARKARGAERSFLAFGIPFLIGAIRRSRAIGDALIARGAGD